VNGTLRLVSDQNIYAIGDCNSLPVKSGQSAKSQGKYLATLFNSDFNKKDDFVYKSMGTIIKLPNCVYIENEYYSGFAPRFVHDIVHYLNI
jgi:NADH dehydrogenase FAD-containing subunit